MTPVANRSRSVASAASATATNGSPHRFCESVKVMPSQPARSARSAWATTVPGSGTRMVHSSMGAGLPGSGVRASYETISLVCSTGAIVV